MGIEIHREKWKIEVTVKSEKGKRMHRKIEEADHREIRRDGMELERIQRGR